MHPRFVSAPLVAVPYTGEMEVLSKMAVLDTPLSFDRGIATYQVDEWSSFYSLIEEIARSDAGAKHQDFVWRGQRNPTWGLSPSLDRVLEKVQRANPGMSPQDQEELVARHLERFRFAVRGRRGQNPAGLPSDNDWWALGQHYGLATPLLDWSRSPFAAAYFAFEEDFVDDAECRVVYGLNRSAVDLRNRDLNEGEPIEKGRPPVLEFYEPMSDENPRLVAQGGLFTRAPLGMSVQDWVNANFEDSPSPILHRILIPCRDRISCLRALNRMNINHLSLFPDLVGASRFVNLALEDPNL
jgi:hypothetical protein